METREEANRFGELVRRRRKEAGFGLRELARKIEMDYSRLSRIERGLRPPPEVEYIVGIAEHLDVERVELLEAAGLPREILGGSGEEGDLVWITGEVVGSSSRSTRVSVGSTELVVAERIPTGARRLEVGIRPRDVTLFTSAESFEVSSARNLLECRIEGLEVKENYNLVELDCGDFSLKAAVTDGSLERMGLEVDGKVYASFKATAPVVRGGS